MSEVVSTVVGDWNDIVYTIKGTNIKHRADGPAVLYGNPDADWYWFMNDVEHRYYGRCCSWHDAWCIHGRLLK